MAKFRTVKSSTQAAAYNNGTGLKGGLTSYSGNQIQPRVKIGSASEATGSLIRAKGSRKFLATDMTTIQDEDIVAGNTYMISLLSNTNWASIGGPVNPLVGDIFTATKNGTGSSFVPDNGQVFAVATCTLANLANSSLTANTITITCTKADSSTFRAKRITNKHVWDFSDNKYLVGTTATNATTPPTVSVARA